MARLASVQLTRISHVAYSMLDHNFFTSSKVEFVKLRKQIWEDGKETKGSKISRLKCLRKAA